MNIETVFAKAFIPLQQVYGHTLELEILQIYAQHLKSKLTAEQLAKACVHVLDNFKPTSACRFPTPAHFVEYATGNSEEKATNAVSRVLAASRRVGPNASISFDDKPLHRTVERFGGWEEMRDFDWRFQESNFKKVYIAELHAGDNFGPDYLEGVHERTNRLTQHTWTHGTARPLLITHVSEHGEPVKYLPPPSRDIPKAIEPQNNFEKELHQLNQKLGM